MSTRPKKIVYIACVRGVCKQSRHNPDHARVNVATLSAAESAAHIAVSFRHWVFWITVVPKPHFHIWPVYGRWFGTSSILLKIYFITRQNQLPLSRDFDIFWTYRVGSRYSEIFFFKKRLDVLNQPCTVHVWYHEIKMFENMLDILNHPPSIYGFTR